MIGSTNWRSDHRLPHLQRRWATRAFWIPALAGVTRLALGDRTPLPDGRGSDKMQIA